MELHRKTKALSKTPFVVYLAFFILLITIFLTFPSSLKSEPIIVDNNNVADDVKIEEIETSKPDIYIPDAEVTAIQVEKKINQDSIKLINSKSEDKTTDKITDNNQKAKEIIKPEEKKSDGKDNITNIGKDRNLTAFIPGTMGKSGKLPSHNCKTKGELTMSFMVDKAGNVTSAGRSSGINDKCATTAAVIWLKQYVKAKKSTSISKGTYTIKF